MILNFNKLSAFLGASSLALCIVGCEAGAGGSSDKNDADAGAAKEGDDGGEQGEGTGSADFEGVDASQLIVLDSLEDRVKKCTKLGEAIYEKHGIKEGQKTLDCEDEGGPFEIELFQVEETCNFLNDTDAWTCSMTYDQLAWCFEGGPECSEGKKQLCALRMEAMCNSESASKDKKSDKVLRQDALHLSKMSKAEFKNECVRRIKADQKKLGVQAGDEHQCPDSSTKVDVEDAEELCGQLEEGLDFSLDFCDLRVGDLTECLGVETYCDPDREHVCGMIVSSCSIAE